MFQQNAIETPAKKAKLQVLYYKGLFDALKKGSDIKGSDMKV